MFGLFKKDAPSGGTILFRGTNPGRPEEFAFLEKCGIRITRRPDSEEWHWSLRLEHDGWGAADLTHYKNFPPPPRGLIDFSMTLSDEEKELALGAGSVLVVRADSTRKNVLRDRKNFLRFVQAAMGDDGLVACDHVSQLCWSRAMLEDELAHDADLDVESVFCLHAVTGDEGGPVTWLHSHGLAELGAFDFDILSPNEDMCEGHGSDICRAIAFAIVEGSVQPSTARHPLAMPGGDVRFVPVGEFNAKAPEGQRSLRDAQDPGHNTDRSVLCDPVGRVRGLFGADVRMSRFLSRPIAENTVFSFSDAATALMAERARKTLKIFGQLGMEFKDLGLPRLVKIGLQVDGGGPSDREHLWFEAHGMSGGTIDATLLNQPHHIARLNAGDRGRHPAELLSDWSIMSPAGSISPRSMQAARFIRENRGMIGEMIRMAHEAEARET